MVTLSYYKQEFLKLKSQKVEDAMLLAYLEERQSRLDQGEKKEVAKKKHKVPLVCRRMAPLALRRMTGMGRMMASMGRMMSSLRSRRAASLRKNFLKQVVYDNALLEQIFAVVPRDDIIVPRDDASEGEIESAKVWNEMCWKQKRLDDYEQYVQDSERKLPLKFQYTSKEEKLLLGIHLHKEHLIPWAKEELISIRDRWNSLP